MPVGQRNTATSNGHMIAVQLHQLLDRGRGAGRAARGTSGRAASRRSPRRGTRAPTTRRDAASAYGPPANAARRRARPTNPTIGATRSSAGANSRPRRCGRRPHRSAASPTDHRGNARLRARRRSAPRPRTPAPRRTTETPSATVAANAHRRRARLAATGCSSREQDDPGRTASTPKMMRSSQP